MHRKTGRRTSTRKVFQRRERLFAAIVMALLIGSIALILILGTLRKGIPGGGVPSPPHCSLITPTGTPKPANCLSTAIPSAAPAPPARTKKH